MTELNDCDEQDPQQHQDTQTLERIEAQRECLGVEVEEIYRLQLHKDAL